MVWRMIVLQNPSCPESREERNSQGIGENTPARRVGTASTVGGVARVWLDLTSYTNWSERTELACRPLPWEMSYWRIAKQSMVAVLAVQKEDRMKALPMQCQQQRKCRLSKPRGTWMTRSGYGFLENDRNDFV
jgi:hypothetical protein